MFTNKHIIIAMIVAPILAVLAYFATDFAVGEKPHAAIPGQSYELIANSNCRYESGKCTLRNGELQLDVRAEKLENSQWLFTLTSNNLLKAAAMTIAPADDIEIVPEPMELVETNVENNEGVKQTWQLQIGEFDKENDKLRVALAAGESFYFAETEAIFPEFETVFENN